MEVIKYGWAALVAVAGALTAVCIYLARTIDKHRKDTKEREAEHRKEREEMRDAVVRIVDDNRRATEKISDRMNDNIEEHNRELRGNTSAVSEMITLIKSIRHDR